MPCKQKIQMLSSELEKANRYGSANQEDEVAPHSDPQEGSQDGEEMSR